MTLFKTDLSQRSNYKWIAFLAIAIGTFTSVADHGSVIVALPFIAEHFQTDLPTTQWVMIGYALAISALLLPMGRLSDIVGLKRVYITGFVIFVISAVGEGAVGSAAFGNYRDGYQIIPTNKGINTPPGAPSLVFRSG